MKAILVGADGRTWAIDDCSCPAWIVKPAQGGAPRRVFMAVGEACSEMSALGAQKVGHWVYAEQAPEMYDQRDVGATSASQLD